jgi:hypothetical protein
MVASKSEPTPWAAINPAAEQAVQADAAARPQDRMHFETWYQPELLPGLCVRRR